MRYIFEFIIFSYSISSFILIIILLKSFIKNFKKSTYKKYNFLFISFLILTFSILSYGSFIEPWLIKINCQTINIEGDIKPNIKIAFLTDPQVGPYKKEGFIKLVNKKIRKANPDIILLGGDYIYDHEDQVEHLRPLGEITKNIPAFAVMGNHEYNVGREGDLENFIDRTDKIEKLLKEINITILTNENHLIEIKGTKLNIIGIDDIWGQKDNLNQAINDINKNYPQILISHNPDGILEAQNTDIDIVVSGHTHGGQIRLPFIGPMVPSVHTKLGRDFYKGLFKFKDTFLLVSAGLGESGPRARLFNRPEINVITLK